MFAGRTRRQPALGYVRRPTAYLRGGRTAVYRPAASRPVAVQTAAAPLRAMSRTVPELAAGHKPDSPRAWSQYAEWFKLPALRPQHLTRSLRAADRRTALLYGMAALVFVAGLGVSLNGLRANRAVAAQVTHLQRQTDAAAGSTTGASANTAVPSGVKPSASSVAQYAVSPNLPRYIDIPALGVHARVLSEGVSSKNQLQVPWNIYDTGWYNASAQPGQQGAMLIDGHSGIDGLKGVFYKLGSLSRGDQITITRGDGQKFTYTVLKVQVVGVDDVNMQSMVVSADATAPGLNLITCTGDQIPGTDQLNERVQVYAAMR